MNTKKLDDFPLDITQTLLAESLLVCDDMGKALYHILDHIKTDGYVPEGCFDHAHEQGKNSLIRFANIVDTLDACVHLEEWMQDNMT